MGHRVSYLWDTTLERKSRFLDRFPEFEGRHKNR